jgi:hypothetical protein
MYLVTYHLRAQLVDEMVVLLINRNVALDMLLFASLLRRALHFL